MGFNQPCTNNPGPTYVSPKCWAQPGKVRPQRPEGHSRSLGRGVRPLQPWLGEVGPWLEHQGSLSEPARKSQGPGRKCPGVSGTRPEFSRASWGCLRPVQEFWGASQASGSTYAGVWVEMSLYVGLYHTLGGRVLGSHFLDFPILFWFLHSLRFPFSLVEGHPFVYNVPLE